MSHSRKDKVGGHRRTEINSKDQRGGMIVWGECGKRYAKRLRSKMGRRHARISLRDLELNEPESFYNDFEEIYENYIEPDWPEDNDDHCFFEDPDDYSYFDSYFDDYSYDDWEYEL